MADFYTVNMTEQAREQLREIVHYISVQLQAPETALRILDVLEEEITSLSQFPNRIALTEEEPWHSQGLRFFPVDNYLIFYLPDETNNIVNIIRIMYGGRDVKRQLSETIE